MAPLSFPAFLVTLAKRMSPLIAFPAKRIRLMGSSDGTATQGIVQAAAPKVGLRQHPIGFWFIFWGEFAERCSYYGMTAILARYMAEQLKLGQANAISYFAIFTAACYTLTLLGGYLADNFFGKYRIIVWFSVPYILGHVVLAVESPWFMAGALVLLAMGSGVIKPNISTLMGMTYEQQRPGQEQLLSNAFAIFYMAINIGAAVSIFAMPWLRTNINYSVAFLFPAGLMVLAFLLFAAGKRFYATEIIVRKVKTPEERIEQWRVVGRIGGLFLLVSLFWAIFYQSGTTWVFFANTYMDRTFFGHKFDPEQFGTANPVLIILLVPVVTFFFNVLARQGIKVRPTDKMIAGFLVAAITMAVMAIAGLRAGPVEKRIALRPIQKTDEPLRDRAREAYADVIVADIARSVDANDDKKLEERLDYLGLLPYCQEAFYRRKALPAVVTSTIGLLGSPSSLCALEAGSVSYLPRTFVDYVQPPNQVTIWWEVLAFFFITVAEILISVTGLELAFTAAPTAMKSFVTGLWYAGIGLGNLFFNVPVGRLYPVMQPGEYFAMLSGMMVVVTVAFVFVARRFNRRNAADAALTR
jgi:dipeptide/tripeptide permease